MEVDPVSRGFDCTRVILFGQKFEIVIVVQTHVVTRHRQVAAGAAVVSGRSAETSNDQILKPIEGDLLIILRLTFITRNIS